MHITLEIAPDVHLAARGLAKRGGKTLGAVISDLARRSLTTPAKPDPTGMRNGFPQLPATGKAISPAFIQSLLHDNRL